jgi:hypothetical protein
MDTSTPAYVCDRLSFLELVRFPGTAVGLSSIVMQTGSPVAIRPYSVVGR